MRRGQNEVKPTFTPQLFQAKIYYQIYPEFHGDYKNANSFYTSFDKMLVKARESGAVDPTKVIDTARGTMGGDYDYIDPDKFVGGYVSDFLDALEACTQKRWDNQQVKPVIWVERDALSRIIHDVAKKHQLWCAHLGDTRASPICVT